VGDLDATEGQKMKGYRTIVWNVANAVILGMDAAKVGYDIPDEWMPLWLGIYTGGNIVLRLVTTGPVGKRNA